ncbi:hypothetical protein WMF31_00785 [Sorangium sp. So ce1036]|uniref:hypothetical protein n=1 Tax=Sorangium sp. So ce1036 TaxID=3133328 RepID=UPI003EFBF3A2
MTKGKQPKRNFPERIVAGSGECHLLADLKEATTAQLLAFGLTGRSGPMSFADALDAAALEMEPLYEALEAKGERWAAGSLHLIQSRVRILAELARRPDVIPDDVCR